MSERPSGPAWPGFALIVGLLAIWAAVPPLLNVPSYVFPSAGAVLSEFSVEPMSIVENTAQTASAALMGLAVAVLVGAAIAIALASNRTVRAQILPVLVISNAIPVVAVAPLLALWLGHGLASKVAIAAFLCFFPFTLTFLDGLTKSQRVFDEMFRIMGASWSQKFLRYVLPNALGNLATGLKVTASIAVIGAVVGEFVGSDRGIGFGILQASYTLNTPRLFAYVAVASLMSLLFYLLPRLWEDRLASTGYISRSGTSF